MRIRIPGVATLLEHGDLPQDLIAIAIREITHPDGAAGAIAEQLDTDLQETTSTLDRLREFGRFQRALVVAAIEQVETADGWEPVELDIGDLDALPEDDLAMVAEIVQRLRAVDARGVRIGVEPLDRWAVFREAHGCPDENCPDCQKVVQQLSSIDVGEV